jgi:hypothetical protein
VQATSLTPRGVALEFISALLLRGDKDRAAQLVDKDAQRHSQGKGTALVSINNAPPPESFTIEEVIFFTEEDLPRMAERFPDDMWQPDRVAGAIKDGGLGCFVLVALQPPPRDGSKRGMMALVIKDVAGTPMIVHTDDN